MSHTSHPFSHRLGVLRTWKSRWFSDRAYQERLREDILLREFLDKRLRGMFVDVVEIERSPDTLNVIIKTTRPGIMIGRGGEGIEKIKKEIEKIIKKSRRTVESAAKHIKLTVEEVRSPEAHAQVMVSQISQDLEKRLPFRRVMKQNLGKIIASKEVGGAKIALAGRLDGSEMARHEWLKEGRIPLQTLRADVDFARGRAHLPYGDIGIKIWIYRGEIFDKK
jgi:small subunit ribosomal protein S3